jgi:hypothetical protein
LSNTGTKYVRIMKKYILKIFYSRRAKWHSSATLTEVGGVQYFITQLSLYPINCGDDEMFRPLWDIFRSQNYKISRNSTV